LVLARVGDIGLCRRDRVARAAATGFELGERVLRDADLATDAYRAQLAGADQPPYAVGRYVETLGYGLGLKAA
jgi:hypothetical protein